MVSAIMTEDISSNDTTIGNVTNVLIPACLDDTLLIADLRLGEISKIHGVV